MKQQSLRLCALLLISLLGTQISNGQKKAHSQNNETPYQSNWESLSKHRTPEWFRDAKFGIYTHWGPNTVADKDATGDWAQWFGQRMYIKSNPTFAYSQKQFGNQDSFGYKDFIPMFTAPKFDANQWAEMFKQAGAKFAGPVAIHHDNFAMWNSKVTKWNSVNMGPHKDIVGELEKAIKSRGMHFMTSFHHSFTWDYYVPAFDYDARDTAYAGLYTMPHKEGDPPSEQFLKIWLAKINEVVTKYQPSLIWFDMGFGETIPASYQKKMFALYYNWAATHNVKGVVAHKSESIHEYAGVLDFERGREDSITPYPWLTDESIKGESWFYQPSDHSWKTANELINLLADIVSKNGDLLLNVGPEEDGTFPDRTRNILINMGNWLKTNGEAIYNTRPWTTYGKGAEKDTGSVRYTQSKDKKTLYAIVLNWIGTGKEIVNLTSLKSDIEKIKSIKILGSKEKVNWKWYKGELQVTVPNQKVDDRAVRAVALKISLK